MGKKSTKVYGIITIQQFLVIALALGYSAYLLAQIPTTDNTLSIICVAFTSFAMLTTLTGGLGNCTQSRSLLKCSGIMGIVCVITFIIIAVFSGLWYGGIQVTPQVAFGDRNITELCVDYDLRNGTDALSDFNATESESAAQVDPVEVDMLGNVTTTQQPLASNDTNVTVSTTTSTTPASSAATTTTTELDEALSFSERRLLYLYCGVSGWMRDLVFGSNDESIGSRVYMLGVLIVSCVLTLLYLISTCLSFHMARRVQNAQFNSWN